MAWGPNKETVFVQTHMHLVKYNYIRHFVKYNYISFLVWHNEDFSLASRRYRAVRLIFNKIGLTHV